MNTRGYQYCGFKIDGEEYAIPVMEVQEVIKPQKLTPVPMAQDSVRGLLNLRGQIVTCINLRVLFGKENHLSGDYMNIIVKGVEGLYSLVVDEVTDIIEVDAENVEKAPETLSPSLKKYVDKVYKSSNGLVILLDVHKLISLKKETIELSA